MSRVCRLSIFCHGATTASRVAGFAADEPLAEGEIAKAMQILPLVSRSGAVISGPELRTRQTAGAFAAGYVMDDAFRDLSYGRWAGKTLEEIAGEDAAGLSEWITDVDALPHGGESISQLLRRVSGWMDGNLQSEGHRLIITHASVIRAMIIAVLDAPPQAFWKIDVEPNSLTDIRSDGRRWALRSFGRVLQA